MEAKEQDILLSYYIDSSYSTVIFNNLDLCYFDILQNCMKLYLFIIAIFITTVITAQQTGIDSISNNPVYIADAKIQLHDLKNYTTVFVDSSNKMTIQEIVSERLRIGFQPVTDSMQAQPYITYWLKISISASGDIQNWWLLSEGQHLYVNAWCLNNKNQVLDHQRTGLFVPRSQKSIKEDAALNRVLFSAKSGEIKNVYLKIYNEYSPSIISSLQLRNPVIGFPGMNSNVMSVISSSVFVFAILSFFFFFFMKEKAYLFFGTYTLTVSLHYLILHPDLPFVDWFIPEHPHLAVPAFYLLTIGGWISFVLFGRYFINLPELSRRIDTIFKWVVALWIVCFVTVITLITVKRRVMFIEVNFIFILLFIIFLVRIAFFKSTLVRFYVAGALWLVGFSTLGILGVSTPYLNPFPIGQLGQILIYAAGLAYKMRLNENARVEAQIVSVRNVELANLYEETNKQKEEIEVQKTNAEEALVELKAAQTQLIQSEKMASLGELTAGIAHEIQNPLNFVNNFSEVNKELLVELKNEIKKGNIDEVIAIADDVISNEDKINHHGKRADAIVKGMLQHSRSSSGVHEPTDINKLADEYLRLAYHGLRAKNKSFNASLETGYDESIGHIDIVPQDIGRVILNLLNNAFYAVDEKKEQQPTGYEPIVSISTKKSGDKVLIAVKDNGNGIPQKILDKMFQPFFTTKPTGQGTGLGLSLSYDIVKAHGGEIKAETKEGKGAAFIIQLPVK
jgi:signal transduction histidine kinase